MILKSVFYADYEIQEKLIWADTGALIYALIWWAVSEQV